MKKIIISLVCLCMLKIASGQNCLEMRLTVTLNKVPMPQSSCEGNFGMATIAIGTDGFKYVKDAGSTVVQLEDEMKKTDQAFTEAVVQAHSPAAQQQAMQQAQQQAQQQMQQYNSSGGQNMSQQQAMQLAQQQQMGNPNMQDKPQNLKLVFKAQTANLRISRIIDSMNLQLKPLRDKLAADLSQAQNAPPDRPCPGVLKNGVSLPACGCLRSQLKKSYEAQIMPYDSYDAQIPTIEKDYITRVSQQFVIIDECITKLNYGKILISATYKQLLASVQSSAYGNIASFLGLTEDTIISSAKAYCPLVNLNDESDDKLGCN